MALEAKMTKEAALEILCLACTTLLTFYRVSAKRGSLLANVAGIVVHDHWHPYYTLKNVLHALCNAHHLRELKALVEIEKEDWARRMQRLLRRACHAVNLASAHGVRLKPELIALIERCYDAIVADGMAFHAAQPALAKARPRGRPPRRVGHNLQVEHESADPLAILHRRGRPIGEPRPCLCSARRTATVMRPVFGDHQRLRFGQIEHLPRGMAGGHRLGQRRATPGASRGVMVDDRIGRLGSTQRLPRMAFLPPGLLA